MQYSALHYLLAFHGILSVFYEVIERFKQRYYLRMQCRCYAKADFQGSVLPQPILLTLIPPTSISFMAKSNSDTKKNQSAKNQKKSSPALWYGATGVLLAIAGIVIYMAFQETEQRVAQATVAVDGDLPEYNVPTWTKGDPEAENTIVVYSDFGCGHCARFHTVVVEYFEEYGDTFHFVPRKYPINNNFPSRAAAAASVAAGNQGKYWEMSDLLYFNTDRWRTENPEQGFMAMAEYLELDMEQFRADLRDEDLMYNIVQAHLSARDYGINATPTAFMNGEQIRTPQNPEQLHELVTGE